MDQATGNAEEPTLQSQQVEGWTNQVQTTLDGLADVHAEDIVNRNRLGISNHNSS